MENMSFEELLNQTLKEIKVGQTVTGEIINVSSKGEVFVDLGYKADGIIPRNDVSQDEDEDINAKFKIGDRITAEVVKLNDGLGNVLLSYRKANSRIAKQELESKIKNDCIFTEKVIQASEKGLVVDYKGIRIFIPYSLSAIKKDENVADYVGKRVSFKIIEYNEQARKVIGSIKVIADQEKQAKEDEFWNNVEVGKTYKGIVSSLSSYGAFIDIDGVQGLLHISGITWERDKKPADILKVDQEIKVKVLEFDKENKRLKLEYDKKGPNPWEKFAEEHKVNDVLTVKVSNMMPFGAFVKIDKGIEGLVHISQICEKKIARPEDVLKIGQKVNAKIINIDVENKKIELSIRELEGTSNELVEEEPTEVTELTEVAEPETKAEDVQVESESSTAQEQE